VLKEKLMDLRSTYLHKEIYEQPAVLEKLLLQEETTAAALAQAIRERNITHVVIAARGTSDNAARYAKYVLGAMNGLPVGLAAPSMFTLYKRPPRLDNALALGISQSGKSPDIVSVLAEARRQGALTAVITNEPGSDLAAQGEFVLKLHAGQERATAATKTYSAELAAIALLSTLLAQDDRMMGDLSRIPGAAAQALDLESAIRELAPRYRYMSRSIVIGRGYNYCTAFELALKLKELTYTAVEPYSSADFLHGPVAMIEPGFPVIVIAPLGALKDEIRSFVRTLLGYQAEVLCFTNDEELLKWTPLHVVVAQEIPEWLSPIPMIIPGQLFSLHLAGVRNYDVDTPRHIRKVTETH
jgi:glucosamine--fructose-6-phosphate aminotransferase (isomerizing)